MRINRYFLPISERIHILPLRCPIFLHGDGVTNRGDLLLYVQEDDASPPSTYRMEILAYSDAFDPRYDYYRVSAFEKEGTQYFLFETEDR